MENFALEVAKQYSVVTSKVIDCAKALGLSLLGLLSLTAPSVHSYVVHRALEEYHSDNKASEVV